LRLLRPQLRYLRDYARRELRILELAEVLHPGEVNVADLMDEVLTLAWERFEKRPRHLPLYLWLLDLLNDVFERVITQEPRPHVSLEEKVDAGSLRKARSAEEEEWWAELLRGEDTFTLQDLIPNAEAAEPLQKLEAAEARDRLLSLLGELPTAQRQAFMLHVLEDYDTAELAMFQDRPESPVKAEIEAARETLRERLLAAGDVQKAAKADASETSGK
jgi:DNA-directed RNA polymerase specialized sigma24 family protein